MSSAEIRQRFLDFFKSKGHDIVPSAPIVIKNDPTLMFTNAGMNQFKDYFLGNKKPPFLRVADTQKCLRVSGKHNDLEEVGVDTYHHTMFEMLGNWSFGDYFKPDAIAWSWELLTEVYKIEKDRLYVTVFEGDAKEHLPADDEAFNEWKKWISEGRILFGSKKDNFWEMGDTGPCGPCSEIHVDSRSDEERKVVDGKTLVNADHPQVIEIWNNVFIQFNRLKDGTLQPLPAKHVDTGMGFERLVRVLQNKHSNYDTDVFTRTIEEIEKIVNKKYDYSESKEAIAFRVIADHIRAISFTIADGQLPSNTGAGYVIRRILRRAVRYYYSYLGYKQALLNQLVPVIGKQFENVFPELQKQADFVSKVVREEEDAFLRTLEKGIQKFDTWAKGIKSIALIDQVDTKTYEAAMKFPGEEAFELYDTYGFPVDLTELMAKEIGINGVEMDEFTKLMQLQKQRSRAATTVDTGDWVVVSDEHAQNEFVGYDSLEIKTKVVKYRKVKSKGKESYQIVLEATPFYAESGGQVGDEGELIFSDGTSTQVTTIIDTKKENDLIVHYAAAIPNDLTGDVIAKVDVAKRKSTEIHHSATHLLHAALRTVLGTHVEQKGSLVNAEHLRFDFSHFAKMTDEEIRKVESLVNEKIRENIPVIIKLMPKEDAMKMGAMALFGEKYSDTVRVVVIDRTYSMELCGGTHVGSTGELGFFKIKHETAIAAGVRRIEAVSGLVAEELVNAQFEQLRLIREFLKNPKDVSKAIENLSAENAELKRKLESAEAKQLSGLRDQLIRSAEDLNGVNFIGANVEVSNAEALKKLCFEIKSQLANHIAVLTSNVNGKAAVAISIDEAVAEQKNLDAAKIIKEHVAPVIRGGGGGQKTLATAGGQDASNLARVIEVVRKLLIA
ncbi:MAG TPA: alanine--tRNA ligase [Parafilimonas sp.]|nr:alanine--tRNA ligase [Parafilimonas sp.]